MSAKILVVDDEKSFCELYTYTLEQAKFQVETAYSAEEALQKMQKTAPSLVLSDVRLPGINGLEFLQQARLQYPETPFLLVTAYADVRDAVNALKIGAVDYLEKPVDLDELVSAVQDVLGMKNHSYHPEIPDSAREGIVAQSPAMFTILRDAYRIASSDANLLITGESGTGKEVIAKFIHEQSTRRNKPLVAINCSAIPATLLSSELFGHEKGAFTGAVTSRPGRFREADGGTLFLDEIGDMPLELQPALLRALETRCVTPVGASREIKLDFRLIAATNRNIWEDVQQGRFREDLYYRLNVILFELPPLRERLEDILPLARNLLSQEGAAHKKLSRAAAKLLSLYPWPGNVRELSNAIEHACLLSQTSIILPEHFPLTIRNYAFPSRLSSATTPPNERQTLREIEIEAIKKTLLQTEGNRTQAAQILGITRRGLLIKLKRYEIDL